MERRIKLLLVFALFFPLLSGCWDQLTIEDRATILGIAIDEVDPETVRQQEDVAHSERDNPLPQKPGIRLTAHIAVPGRLPLGAQETDNEKSPVWTMRVIAHTLDAAMADLQQEIADELFFGHLRVVVVSEAVAKNGLREWGDYLRRNPEIRRTAWLAVSQGEAAELMKIAPPLERVPTLYLTAMLDHAVELGKFPNMSQGRFWSYYSAKGREPYLPYLQVQEEKSIKMKGLAYFRGDTMVGVTEPIQIDHFMGIMGLDPGGYSVLLPVPDGGDSAYYIFTKTDRKARRKLTLKNGRPHITVDILIEGDVGEKVGKPLTENLIRKMEKQIEKLAQDSYYQLMKQTQKQRSDIFAFGESVRGKLPGYWNTNVQTSEKWREIYEDLPVELKVKIKIRRVGMKEK